MKSLTGLDGIAVPYTLLVHCWRRDSNPRHEGDHRAAVRSLAKNVTMGYFEAGHMMYIHGPSRLALKQDLASFIRAASGSTQGGD